MLGETRPYSRERIRQAVEFACHEYLEGQLLSEAEKNEATRKVEEDFNSRAHQLMVRYDKENHKKSMELAEAGISRDPFKSVAEYLETCNRASIDASVLPITLVAINKLREVIDSRKADLFVAEKDTCQQILNSPDSPLPTEPILDPQLASSATAVTPSMEGIVEALNKI